MAMVVGVGASAVAAACLISPSAVEHGPELCVFRRLTGLPCPGCGLTRSWVMAAHGDIDRAFAFNVFGPLLLAIAVAAVLVGGWMLATGRGAPQRLSSRPAIRAATGFVAIWVGYGVLRAVDAGLGWGIFPSVT